MHRIVVAAIVFGMVAMLAPFARADDAKVGDTRVAKWRGDAKASFRLWFDDGCASHIKNAIPELTQRKLNGTFYLNPAAGQYKANLAKWEQEVPKLGFEYGNHTFTHKGAKSVEDLEAEVTQCNDVLARIASGAKPPGLVSFARPGVAKGAWTVSDEDLKKVLAKHNLIDRPKLDHGMAMVHVKTADQLIKAVEKAVASGGTDFVLLHGVGGDWFPFPMPEYVKLLDYLDQHRADVWCPGEIEYHKYVTERDAATVKVLSADDKQIRVSLSSTADPKLYDTPLTLVTRVPAAWTKCTVSVKSAADAEVAVTDGQVRYDVAPGSGVEVTVKPAGK